MCNSFYKLAIDKNMVVYFDIARLLLFEIVSYVK